MVVTYSTGVNNAVPGTTRVQPANMAAIARTRIILIFSMGFLFLYIQCKYTKKMPGVE